MINTCTQRQVFSLCRGERQRLPWGGVCTVWQALCQVCPPCHPLANAVDVAKVETAVGQKRTRDTARERQKNRQKHRGGSERDQRQTDRQTETRTWWPSRPSPAQVLGLCDKAHMRHQPGPEGSRCPPPEHPANAEMHRKPPWTGRCTRSPILTGGAVPWGLGAAVLVGDALQGREGQVQAAVGAGPEGAETVAIQIGVALQREGCVRASPPGLPPNSQPGPLPGTPRGWLAPF